ncbi:E3 ubiquitin-protein ligase hecd-1-like [Pocillopora damicornis]|nr:E3 ubiquitin-protein ligase hecd-1-like [Pocillopora damicornis]
MANSTRNEDTSNITQWRQARVTENHILLICDDVGRFWIDLGTILKLPPAEVVNIEDEFRYNRDRAWKVMKRWLQMKGREATVGILADALEQMKMRNAVEKLIEKVKVEAGLNSVRAASGKLRKDVELLRVEIQNGQRMQDETRKEYEELNCEMQTATGEEGRKNMETRMQRLETTIERLERQDPLQKLTRLLEICGRIDEGLRDVQESVRKVSENQNAAVGRSFEADRNTSDEPIERQQEETTSEDTIQRDTIRRDSQNQRESELIIKPLLDGNEMELNDVEKERDSLKTKSGQPDQTSKSQLERKRKLKTNNKQVKVERNEAIEPNKVMVEQIQKLEAEKKELEMTLNGQTDLMAENEKLSTQIERLTKEANNSEFECKRLQEELKTYINYQSHVFLPAGKEFAGICTGVICFLKQRLKDAPCAELIASRSSDGPGDGADVLNHKTGTVSATEEKKNSWWSIDLGSSHRLVITHYALRHGKREKESLLTQWQLKGSNDGKQWENIDTIRDKKDPQFKDPSLFCTGKWSVKGEIGPFRYFRIFQTGVNSSGKYGIYLSGIELYGVLLNMCELTETEALSYKVFIKQPNEK